MRKTRACVEKVDRESGKSFSLGQFLSDTQIKECIRLKDVSLIKKQVIEPDIGNINVRLGQYNDPGYLAYAVVYCLQKARLV